MQNSLIRESEMFILRSQPVTYNITVEANTFFQKQYCVLQKDFIKP